MDGERFDALTRVLTDAVSCRRRLPTAAASPELRPRDGDGMDGKRFDSIAEALGRAGIRRGHILRGRLVAAGAPEGAVAACLATGRRCGAGREPCCSGVCSGPRDKKTCRCPQRICCQCRSGEFPFSCSFVTSSEECETRCAEQGTTSAPITFHPAPGLQTTACKIGTCRHVDCLP